MRSYVELLVECMTAHQRLFSNEAFASCKPFLLNLLFLFTSFRVDLTTRCSLQKCFGTHSTLIHHVCVHIWCYRFHIESEENFQMAWITCPAAASYIFHTICCVMLCWWRLRRLWLHTKEIVHEIISRTPFHSLWIPSDVVCGCELCPETV